MTETYKVLGQDAPGAATLTKLYTVPAATQTVCSSLVVTNRSGAAKSFRVSIRIAGAADAPKQYLYYDVNIPRNDTFVATLGITLATTDEVWVYGSTGDLSFNLFGTEITA